MAGAVVEFAGPANGTGGPVGIAVSSDGAVWFTEPDTNRIGRMTPEGEMADWAVPTPRAYPYGMTIGPDGAAWFTEFSAGKIGRAATRTRPFARVVPARP